MAHSSAAKRWIGSTAVAVVALTLAATSADAGSPPPPRDLVVAPTSVSYLTTIEVSGTGCVDPQTLSGTGNVVLLEAPGLAVANTADPEGQHLGLADVEADGTWTFTYVVPAEAANFMVAPGADRELRATCGVVDPPTTHFEYDPVSITFEAPATTTTSSVAPLVPPVVTDPAPAPATPVSGTANFTG